MDRKRKVFETALGILGLPPGEPLQPEVDAAYQSLRRSTPAEGVARNRLHSIDWAYEVLSPSQGGDEAPLSASLLGGSPDTLTSPECPGSPLDLPEFAGMFGSQAREVSSGAPPLAIAPGVQNARGMQDSILLRASQILKETRHRNPGGPLQQLRQSQGITSGQLAERAQLSPRVVIRLESWAEGEPPHASLPAEVDAYLLALGIRDPSVVEQFVSLYDPRRVR